MIRLILTYGAALATLALLAQWMDWRFATQAWSTSAYGLAVALLFAGLGIWLGMRLVPRARTAPFARNDKAMTALGISARECEVLDLLVEGASNKLIARRLGISPNTVKTHVSRLFEKIEAASRTELVHKARGLNLVP